MTRDLMYRREITRLVTDAYREVRAPGGPGAGFYRAEQLARLPAAAHEWALGVGDPLRWAQLTAGETVLDVGCGAGIDVLLAEMEVAPKGRAIGVDLLTGMVERARALAAGAGIDNVEFRQAEMEALPLDDACVDVVIANGSINLSARKSRVLAEAHRVLRPGGRLCVTDLTIREEELPSQILTHPAAWAG